MRIGGKAHAGATGLLAEMAQLILGQTAFEIGARIDAR